MYIYSIYTYLIIIENPTTMSLNRTCKLGVPTFNGEILKLKLLRLPYKIPSHCSTGAGKTKIVRGLVFVVSDKDISLIYVFKKFMTASFETFNISVTSNPSTSIQKVQFQISSIKKVNSQSLEDASASSHKKYTFYRIKTMSTNSRVKNN